MSNVQEDMLLKRTRHNRLSIEGNKRQMQTQENKIDKGKALDADLVVTESSGIKSEVQDDSSRLGNDTDVDDIDIKPIYDEDQCYNKAKMKKGIDAFETINIELEHSVVKLLTVNEHLNKENETLKKHYKDLYDSIKITRSKTIEQTTSLLANNVDLKAQIQEKVLGKPVLQPLRNQSVIRQPNAFKSKRPKISKPRFASQVDVEKDLSKPVTQHYLPKGKESAFAKPNHMIASSSSRNSSKNMLIFSSNDMVHNHYLEEAKKTTQEKDRNSKSSVMHSTRLQNTTNGSKQKPRSNNQTTRSLPASKSSCVTSNVVPLVDHSRNSSPYSNSKHFVCSTCHKCVFNANHDACITKLLKEVNSCKVKSHKTRNSNKPIEQKRHTQQPGRQIFTGHRILNNVGLRWVPTGKIFTSCTSKADSESTHGSKVDISKIRECKQTLDLSAGTSLTGQQKQRIDFSAGLEPQWQITFEHNGSSIAPQCQRSSYSKNDKHNVDDRVGKSIRSSFDEYFNGENQVVSKSSAVTTADASDKHQQQPDSTSSTSTLATTVSTDGNFDLVMLFSIHSDEWKSFQSQPQTALRGSNTLSWKPCQGGSSKLNLPDHRYKRRCCSLIPAESDSLPHAHAQTTKTYYKHQDSRIKKAQELKTKTSANSDIKDPSSKTKLRGRLLESFQEDAKYEHVGQDTRSQDGKDDKDKQGKDLKISESKTKSTDNDKG
ncbi:hypothetical protein Tco_0499980 [Tanacetum coccineum]